MKFKRRGRDLGAPRDAPNAQEEQKNAPAKAAPSQRDIDGARVEAAVRLRRMAVFNMVSSAMFIAAVALDLAVYSDLASMTALAADLLLVPFLGLGIGWMVTWFIALHNGRKAFVSIQAVQGWSSLPSKMMYAVYAGILLFVGGLTSGAIVVYLDAGVALGLIGLAVLGLFAYLIGLVFVLFGMWRVGKFLDSRRIRVAAFLSFFPLISMVGALMVLSAVKEVDLGLSAI